MKRDWPKTIKLANIIFRALYSSITYNSSFGFIPEYQQTWKDCCSICTNVYPSQILYLDIYVSYFLTEKVIHFVRKRNESKEPFRC